VHDDSFLNSTVSQKIKDKKKIIYNKNKVQKQKQKKKKMNFTSKNLIYLESEALEDVSEDRNYLFHLILISHNPDDVFED
jgi:hypothetical protein